jgi:exopolyphosphatase/guanosine-5'-triphosphate,3'-diphosphate pyrophosphatase
MRVATVDIGTNTVLLLVAEAGPGGMLRAVEERAEITRLGEGVDRTRRLTPEAIARTCACLDRYAAVARDAGAQRVAVVGTSAMRDADGGQAVQERVRAAFGVDARVVSGEEEARLAFRGALNGLEPASTGPVAVFDIGGGSTEVILGSPGSPPRIVFAESFDVGSVRLTERYIRHDPPEPAEIAAVSKTASDLFVRVPPLMDDTVPVGVAGTMTTLACVSLALVTYDGARVHGYAMRRSELARIAGKLSAMDLASRRAVAGMEPKRADVIVAGALVALALLDHWKAQEVRVSDRGVRWGLAEELLFGLER